MQAVIGNTRGGPHPLGLGSIVAGMLALLAGMLATRPAPRAELEPARGERASAPRVASVRVAIADHALGTPTVRDADAACSDAAEQPDRASRPERSTSEALHRATPPTHAARAGGRLVASTRRHRLRVVTPRLLARAPPR
jgi:hypothetical protein